MKAFVYVISAGLDAQKIGVARDVAKRIAYLQVGNPALLVAVHQVDSDDAWLVERYAHWLLREHRLRGEWFSVEPHIAVQAVNAAHGACAEDSLAASVRITAGSKPTADDWIRRSVGWYAVNAETAMERRERNAALCRALLPRSSDPDTQVCE